MLIPKDSISNVIWDIKYRYRQESKIIDQSFEATWRRVAGAVAQAEKESKRKNWEKAFYQLLEDFRFLPGGRILAGAGTNHQVTLFNCFVMDIAEDSLKGIFDALEEGALTLQQGGGVGYDFSVLRPQGSFAKKTGVVASGPVSFMRIWDTMCSVILSTGARRGAMMGILRCDHPDIEQFIAAKRDSRELRHFNISVMVSDAFMEAVKKDATWQLVFPLDNSEERGPITYRYWGNALRPVRCCVYRIIKARKLWEEIIRSAYDFAEPGVLFSDTINRMNNLWYCERINATNPCGEIPLPAYGACNLGAINLTRFVSSPFTNKAKINWAEIEETAKIATRFLDNVIDISRYPLSLQRSHTINTRRIGLGLTGLADMFVMLGIQYGSEESFLLAKEVMQRISNSTWDASIELAHEKGKFPYYSSDYLKSEFVMTLDNMLQQKIKRQGVRNSHHNTIAPTGTISLLANNVSNGIEPIYSAEYVRHVRINDVAETFRVKDYAYQYWLNEGQKNLPPAWVDVQVLPPAAHLHVQSAVQPYIDNAISKTINIPENFPFEKLVDVYTQAYELGLKGCTVFRPNPITGSVIEIAETTDHCCQLDN